MKFASLAGSVNVNVALVDVPSDGWPVRTGSGGGVGTQALLPAHVMLRLGMLGAVYPSLVLVPLTVVV